MGIGHHADVLPQNIDWQEVKDLAEKQGVSAVVLDGINCLGSLNGYSSYGPPRIEKLQWIGEVDYNYERYYATYKDAISSLAGFYNQHGFKMMVLKGYACSLDWPKPNHRPCGDIDIWLFGDYVKADKTLCSEKNIKTDNSHEHHTVFCWRDIMVENHYDFIDIHHRETSSQLEKIFKELGRDDSRSIQLQGEIVYLPSLNLHALFLLRHSMEHFASTRLTLRQLLDWAFFVKKHGSEVDWEWLIRVLDEFGMTPAFNIFNAICVEDLGFDANIFPSTEVGQDMKQKVLGDILSPEFCGEEPKMVLTRIIFKFRRWEANKWKHRLCFKESMWSAFWSGVWGHILKPRQI